VRAFAHRPAVVLARRHRCAGSPAPTRSPAGCRARSPTPLRSLPGRRARSPAMAALAFRSFRSSPSGQAMLDVAALLRLGSMTTTGTSTRPSMAAWRPAKARRPWSPLAVRPGGARRCSSAEAGLHDVDWRKHGPLAAWRGGGRPRLLRARLYAG
jgi:hypothetical protein